MSDSEKTCVVNVSGESEPYRNMGQQGLQSIDQWGFSASPIWSPASAASAFLKIQYAQTDLRCFITHKMIAAGSPVMLIGGVVISQEAFEHWLEKSLLSPRHEAAADR